MSVNWSWKEKKGEVIIARKELGSEKVETYKLNIYEANCLGAFIYEWKDTETKKNMYSFYMFFNDMSHLKKCLGLEASEEYDFETHKNVKTKKNILCTETEWWKLVKLNTYYSDTLKMAEAFAKAGIKVELYYKESEVVK